MAAENDKTVVATAETAEAPAASGGKKKLILFGGIGAGILVIGVLLAVFVLKPMMGSSSEEPSGKEGKGEQTAKVEKKEKAEKPKAKKEEKGKEKSGEGLVYAIKDIVINPAGTGGSRFLSVSFGFDLGSQEAATQFEEREPQVRDVLITILSSKTLAELTDAKQKEIMRLQIKKRLMQVLDTEDLNGVYYTDFVLQ
jgi:flagellar FliL protein